MKPVIDVCCGSRMFWFNKEDDRALFMDKRALETTLCDGRSLEVKPNVIGDFRNMEFDDGSFHLVVFDPPHLLKAGDDSWLAKKYGKLSDDWKNDLKAGFKECFRILKTNGTLIFKWNEEQVRLAEILKLTPEKPLFGHKRQKTHFIVFIKEGPGHE